MTPKALADLRALAEAARDTMPAVDDRNKHISPNSAWQDWFGYQADYMRAVRNPDVVLALLERAERAEDIVDVLDEAVTEAVATYKARGGSYLEGWADACDALWSEARALAHQQPTEGGQE